MSPENTREDLRAQILEEAAAWTIELNDDELDPATRREFNRWIRRSPEHISAYLEISVAWEQSIGLDRRASLDPATLIREALDERESNVVPFSGSNAGTPPDEPSARAPARRLKRWGGALAAGLVLASVSAWIFFEHNAYSTGIGEQRSVALSDGSTLQLNARSKLRIAYTQRERAIDLLEGQALFEVSKEANRPFVVRIGTTRVRALGTQFDVYRKSGATVITVVDGSVAVSEQAPRPSALTGSSAGSGDAANNPAAEEPVVVGAGEQITVVSGAMTHAAPARSTDITAWTQRKIVFDETSLKDAVAEFNRYSTTRIVIENPGLEGFHVRGTFSTLHPETLAQFLRQRFGVTVIETPSEIRISGEPQTD